MIKELQGANQIRCSTQVEEIMQSIVSRVKLIRDCIIYDEYGDLKEENINFKRVLQVVGDRTGYEVSCSEIRLSKERIPKEQLLHFAYGIRNILSQIVGDGKVVVYISLLEDDVELRFHRYRKNEKSWLVDELNEYSIPIMRLI